MVFKMNKQQIVQYYNNDAVAERIFENAKNREVAGVFFSGNYEKRPNMLQYKEDVKQMALRGITSFHFSVERWAFPMQLSADNYDELRIGFDILIDIDSKLGIEEAQTAAILICNFLEKYGIKNYGLKFSGSRGFHICIPNEMLPKEIDYKKTEKMYPLLPKIISRFIRKNIAADLMKELLKRKTMKELVDILGEKPEEMSPFYFVDVEKNWGARHMFRAPYSLNEKTWNVSLPLNLSQLKNFSVGEAKPENALKNIEKAERFFKGKENEAASLIMDAMDWYATVKKEPVPKRKITKWENKINEELFPPCIKLILSGLKDGRKRSVFTLINFLRMMNWDWQEIEEKLYEWNKKNRQALQRSIILGQIRYQQRQESRPPANCFNDEFYVSIGVCRPDETCKLIKNPIGYPFKKIGKRIVNAKEKINIYKCRCGLEFKSMKSLNIHIGRVHGGEL